MADDMVAGCRGWIISDDKAGNNVQAQGVFDALGITYDIKVIDPRGLYKWLSPWAPVDPREGFGTPGSQFHAPWPDFAVSIGRLTTPYMRRLKKAAGLATYTIILQDPKVGTRAADLYWVPEHDTLRGPNVITTLTAPHSFSPARLAALRAHMPEEVAALPQPRIAVTLGGPNGDYQYTAQSLRKLASALQSLIALGAGLMITPSRRTPPGVAQFVREASAAGPRLFWDGKGENPYPQFLAHADAFIAPADSVNMTGEPAVTGKPVYVFEPDGGSAKFTRFHGGLRRHGVTRPMPERFERFETWTYPPLDSARDIAAEIVRRWSKRRAMLGAGGAITPPP